jgi:hypothetical protein
MRLSCWEVPEKILRGLPRCRNKGTVRLIAVSLHERNKQEGI